LLQGNLRDTRAQMNQVRFDLIKVKSSLNTHDARVQAIRETGVSDEAVENALEADGDVKSLRARIDRLEEVLGDWEARAGNTPTVRAARDRLNDLYRALEQKRAHLRVALRKRVETNTRDSSEIARLNLQN